MASLAAAERVVSTKEHGQGGAIETCTEGRLCLKVRHTGRAHGEGGGGRALPGALPECASAASSHTRDMNVPAHS